MKRSSGRRRSSRSKGFGKKRKLQTSAVVEPVPRHSELQNPKERQIVRVGERVVEIVEDESTRAVKTAGQILDDHVGFQEKTRHRQPAADRKRRRETPEVRLAELRARESWNVDQAAEYYECHRSTVYRMLKTGKLQRHPRNPRRILNPYHKSHRN